jgi:hypothetical protein
VPYLETKCEGAPGSASYLMGPSFDLPNTCDISDFRKFYHRLMTNDIKTLLDMNPYLKSIGHSGALIDLNNHVQRQVQRG